MLLEVALLLSRELVHLRQRFAHRCQGRDPGHTGIRAGRGPLALRCGYKPHRRAERPSGRSDPVVGFVRSRQRFVHRCHGRKKAPAV